MSWRTCSLGGSLKGENMELVQLIKSYPRTKIRPFIFLMPEAKMRVTSGIWRVATKPGANLSLNFNLMMNIRISERTDWLVDKFKMKTECKIILFVLPCIRQCWGPSRVEEEEEESCEVPHLEASEGSVRRDSGGKFREWCGDDLNIWNMYQLF